MKLTAAHLCGTLSFLALTVPVLAQCPASAVCGVRTNLIIWNAQFLDSESGPTIDQRYWAERCAAKPGCVAYIIKQEGSGAYFSKGPISSLGYIAYDRGAFSLFDLCCPLPPVSTTTTSSSSLSTTSLTISSSSSHSSTTEPQPTTPVPSTTEPPTSSSVVSSSVSLSSSSVSTSQNTTSSTSTSTERFSNATTTSTFLSTSASASLPPTTEPPGPVVADIVTNIVTNSNCITVVSIIQSCPLAAQNNPCTVGQISTYTIPDVIPRPTGDLGSGWSGGQGSATGSSAGGGQGAGAGSGPGFTARPSPTPISSSPSIGAPASTSSLVRAAAGSVRPGWAVALGAVLAALL